MEETLNQQARSYLQAFEDELKENIYTADKDYQHSLKLYLKNFSEMEPALVDFGAVIAEVVEPLVNENNQNDHLPQLEAYDALGNKIDIIRHHASYILAGDYIYQSNLMKNMAIPGRLMESMALFFLASQAGEAGHNCPIACSAGLMRILQKFPEIPHQAEYLAKLALPAYPDNFTGAQFVTEIQGGSDVGLNCVTAIEEPLEKNMGSDELSHWRIYGEKWFCSNAGADLILLTARYDTKKSGTKGLALFLVPAIYEGKKNLYTIRRLKDKIGTRSMATGEIDFEGAYAYLVGDLEDSFNLVMENVLHISRLLNTLCVLGMARRALTVAKCYAKHRVAFQKPILEYPLVQETLARIRAENTAMLAGVFATIHLQDKNDVQPDAKAKLLLRTLVNFQKYFSAKWSVMHINQALGVLAGNGAIETFSPIPRLLRDCIVCENWEGAHNVLRMQILKDILRYQVDEIFLRYLQEELATITPVSPEVELCQSLLQTLSQDFENFKQLSNAQQSIQIQVIVDKMTVTFCAVMLLKEITLSPNENKKQAWELFSRYHLRNTPLSYDSLYLKLIANLASSC